MEPLEDFLRPDELAKDLILLLRGGVYDEDVSRLQGQAAQLDRRFTYQGGKCFGSRYSQPRLTPRLTCSPHI